MTDRVCREAREIRRALGRVYLAADVLRRRGDPGEAEALVWLDEAVGLLQAEAVRIESGAGPTVIETPRDRP
jgi:hypothetical protein